MNLGKHSDFEAGALWGEPGAASTTWAADGSDPRLAVSEQALSDASRNAFPIVATQRTRRDHLGLVAGAAVALVLGCLTFVSMNSRRDSGVEPASASEQRTESDSASAPSREIPPPPLAAQPALTAVAPMTEPQMQALAQPAASGAPVNGATTVRVALAAPAMVFDGSQSGASEAPRSKPGAETAGSTGLLAGATSVQGMAVSESASARSTRIEDPASTVVQGTLIPAVLETAVNSDLPGFARAVVSQDVRSFDDSRILIPRSSRLIGEYKSGLSSGQKRVFLIWTRLVRPDGVSIALSSPAVGFSGEAGIGGKVNSHFLERFGSAMLMSVIGGASTAFSGGATVVVAGGQGAASLAGQRDSGRAPTVRIRQGEPIRVFTARDLIFTSGDGAIP